MSEISPVSFVDQQTDSQVSSMNNLAADQQAHQETLLEQEQLRDLIRSHGFFVHTSISSRSIPEERIFGTPIGEGEQTFGTVPKKVADTFSRGYSTWSAIPTELHQSMQATAERFNQQFKDLGVTEKLTFVKHDKVPYRLADPDSNEADQKLTAIVYEREGTRDHLNRGTSFRFILCLPENKAEIFKVAVTQKPDLIRDMVDIAMLEELAAGEAWNGPTGVTSSPRGEKLAIRTDLKQGPEESQIVSFHDKVEV